MGSRMSSSASRSEPSPDASAGARLDTSSGIPLRPVYRPADLEQSGWSYQAQLGDPGQFPFTRGPYPTMYRGKLWTMRMFSGFGTPEDTNRRFKFLLAQGQTGLSTAMTINAPAVAVLAFYVAAAERQGVPAHRLAGTIQNDMLKEFIAQKEWI